MNRSDYTKPSRVRNQPMSAHRDHARPHSFDAIAKAVPTREAKEAWAGEFNVSISYVEKWMRPHGGLADTGRRNPIDRIVEAINGSLREGVEFTHAVAPVRFICRKFSGEFIGRGAPLRPDDHAGVIARVARGGGDLAGFLAEALADNVLDVDERRQLRTKLDALLQVYIDAEALGEVHVA